MGDNQKYQEHFKGYIDGGHEADGLEELYESVHEKIREDPSPAEKKDFSPDKSFKPKKMLRLLSLKQRRRIRLLHCFVTVIGNVYLHLVDRDIANTDCIFLKATPRII